MNLFVKDEVAKIINEGIKEEKHKFICKICGMYSKTSDRIKSHILMQHALYLRYNLLYESIPPVATQPWIDVEYNLALNISGLSSNDIITNTNNFTQKILYTTQSLKKLLVVRKEKHDINAETIAVKNSLLHYAYWLNKKYINENFRECIPYNSEDQKKIDVGKIPIGGPSMPKLEKNDILYEVGFNRIWTVKHVTEGNKINFLLRFRDGGFQGLEYGSKFLAPVHEKLIYGYSPLDFIIDRALLYELEKVINFTHSSGSGRNIQVVLIEGNSPMIFIALDYLTIKYPIDERIKLFLKAPEIEKRCFQLLDLDGGLINTIKHYKNLKNKDDITKHWVLLVDKLLTKYHLKIT